MIIPFAYLRFFVFYGKKSNIIKQLDGTVKINSCSTNLHLGSEFNFPIQIKLFFFVSVVLIVEQNVKTLPINHQTLTSCDCVIFFQEKKENEFNESYKY